ncbi:hypothetical protein PROFUN_08353 [Planoprotostelium fungivorum]|uniref:Uncharacterized protein n=1 Tax=Planoprotostelium fungivorum TaxID=1890364 RepID=A0A2P6NI58_9EUKA|nr:hypothetical protein PROFUN_08353 [Planoprotostelium fungivorum]
MKLFSIIVFDNRNAEKPLSIARAEDLSMFGFWKRGTIRELITFVSRQLASKTAQGQRQVAAHDMSAEPQDGISKLLCHAYVNARNVSYVVITDGEYPQRTAFNFGQRAVELLEKEYGDKMFSSSGVDQQLTVAGLDEEIKKYQNPAAVDSIAKIHNDLNDTRQIMVENIEKVIARGEKLDDLLAKTDDLSESSKVFVTRAKKMNSCCTIL